jgi:hypothetical protein
MSLQRKAESMLHLMKFGLPFPQIPGQLDAVLRIAVRAPAVEGNLPTHGEGHFRGWYGLWGVVPFAGTLRNCFQFRDIEVRHVSPIAFV